MVTPNSRLRSLAITLPGNTAPLEPEEFTLSACGIEFVTPVELTLFQILELDLDVPAPTSVCSHFVCSGVVVACMPRPDGQGFKTTLLFLDLPDCARKHIDPSL